MKIGIIAEGRADQFVLRNILYAFGVEHKDIRLIRPDIAADEWDSNGKENVENNKAFGSWTNVKNDCISREPFEDFFDNTVGEKYMIVQLDTDICSEYGVQEGLNIKEIGLHAFSVEMRNRIIEKVNEWLAENYTENILYAICIRQIDAWVLTIFAKQQDKDTGGIAMPKKELQGKEAYQKLKGREVSVKYKLISEPFAKKKNLNQYIAYNQSLKDFVTSLASVFN